jgi:hypothetical protein
VTAFVTSLVFTGIMVGIVIFVGKRRPRGTPTTWGEAFVAAVFVFGLLLMIYGIVPDRFLRWADGELKWRSDAIGIPVGPYHFLGNKNNVIFGDGITFFGRGRILVSKEKLRDAVAAGLYIVFGLGQIFLWLWWQNRGKAKPATPELETSAYGRPLVRGS